MSRGPTIVVLAGGTSAEREVSLGSGAACAAALARHHPTRLVVVNEDALPPGLDPTRDVIFSALHGGFGEGGGMQSLLQVAGLAYAGCDAASCALTLDKHRTKTAVAARGLRVARGRVFAAEAVPTAAELVGELGDAIVLKPNNEGSSVGLRLVEGEVELAAALAALTPGEWLAEERLRGRELSIGVLQGEALGVVEIRPKSGVYDYASKYTKGHTDYLAPAPLDEAGTRAARAAAATAFAACGCRDYARIDFFLTEDSGLFLLEINPLPGMKETSLLPMSARCSGLDFTALVGALVQPAVARFAAARSRSTLS
jgi:D-alanine-D-alanine ligase